MKAFSIYSVLFVSLIFVGCRKNDAPVIIEPPARSVLLINEILPGKSGSYAEIYNPGNIVVDLSGYYVFTDEQHKVMIPQGTMIAPHGFWTISGNDTLASVYTGLIFLYTGGEFTIEDNLYRVTDVVKYPGLPASDAYGRLPDGSDNWMVFEIPSRNSSNNPERNRPPKIWDVQLSNATPAPDETVVIFANVLDDHSLAGLLLHMTWAGKDSTMDLHSLACGFGYSTYINPLPVGTTVKCYIKAIDDSLAVSYYPVTAPVEQLSFTVTAKKPMAAARSVKTILN